MDSGKIGEGRGVKTTERSVVAQKRKHSWLVGSLIKLVKEKRLGAAGGIVTLFLLLIGIFANFLAPYGMNETWVGDFIAPPSAEFWLGTDNVGRDLLSRVIFGARISVIVGLGSSTMATAISLVIGMVSGYIGGKLDLMVQRIVDIWMVLPGLIIMMIMITIIGPGVWQIIIVIGITSGVPGSRIVRSAVIGVKENDYVGVAVAIGCRASRILVRHILPNIMAPTIIVFTTRVPNAILVEASLSFLGFGIPPPTPSWGGMLSGTGRAYMFDAPWMVIWPGLALATVVYAINMFGDAVRDLLDPKLRGASDAMG
jgi:peptide/nickel transport system permease protein